MTPRIPRYRADIVAECYADISALADVCWGVLGIDAAEAWEVEWAADRIRTFAWNVAVAGALEEARVRALKEAA